MSFIIKLKTKVFGLQVAIPGANSDVSVSGSKSIALSFLAEDQSEQSISNSPNPFQFTIPRDTNEPLPEFTVLYDPDEASLNDTIKNVNPLSNLLKLSGFILPKNNVSIHYHIKPNNEKNGYFSALYFGGNPYLNKTFERFHMWKILCPIDLRNEYSDKFYVFFANMSHSISFKGFVGFGIKELNSNEFNYFCNETKTSNRTLEKEDLLSNLDLTIEANFTSKITSRVILSGCYYIDKITGLYSSHGVEILEKSNTTHTQCISTHLTQFAGGFITVPNGIDFNDVFANASFEDNMTIYLTVIIMTTLYIILFVWTKYMDKNDKLKTIIKILPDNDKDDIYFYEILFYTGSRPDAGTNSNVFINLYYFYIFLVP